MATPKRRKRKSRRSRSRRSDGGGETAEGVTEAERNNNNEEAQDINGRIFLWIYKETINRATEGARALETNNPYRRFSDVIFLLVLAHAHTQSNVTRSSPPLAYTLVVVASQSEAHERFWEKPQKWKRKKTSTRPESRVHQLLSFRVLLFFNCSCRQHFCGVGQRLHKSLARE